MALYSMLCLYSAICPPRLLEDCNIALFSVECSVCERELAVSAPLPSRLLSRLSQRLSQRLLPEPPCELLACGPSLSLLLSLCRVPEGSADALTLT